MLNEQLKKALFISAFFIGFFSTPSLADNTCNNRRIDTSFGVKYVHDGDTLKLRNNQKIRLLGIDTPELARNKKPAQPFAKQAKFTLQKLIQNNHNTVGLAFEKEKFDKYKRQLAHLYLSNGNSIQAHLLKRGLATAYTTPPNSLMSDCYKRAEKTARLKHLGIWSLPQYQLKNIAQLNKNDNGFRRIRGRVSQVSRGKKGFWLQLGNRVKVHIRNKDLIYFNLQQLQQLRGKAIQLRGWLHPKKSGFYINLRHPDNMSRILKTG